MGESVQNNESSISMLFVDKGKKLPVCIWLLAHFQTCSCMHLAYWIYPVLTFILIYYVLSTYLLFLILQPGLTELCNSKYLKDDAQHLSSIDVYFYRNEFYTQVSIKDLLPHIAFIILIFCSAWIFLFKVFMHLKVI